MTPAPEAAASLATLLEKLDCGMPSSGATKSQLLKVDVEQGLDLWAHEHFGLLMLLELGQTPLQRGLELVVAHRTTEGAHRPTAIARHKSPRAVVRRTVGERPALPCRGARREAAASISHAGS